MTRRKSNCEDPAFFPFVSHADGWIVSLSPFFLQDKSFEEGKVKVGVGLVVLVLPERQVP